MPKGEAHHAGNYTVQLCQLPFMMSLSHTVAPAETDMKKTHCWIVMALCSLCFQYLRRLSVYCVCMYLCECVFRDFGPSFLKKSLVKKFCIGSAVRLHIPGVQHHHPLTSLTYLNVGLEACVHCMCVSVHKDCTHSCTQYFWLFLMWPTQLFNIIGYI